jgi:Tol biopolymer transport system component
MRRLVVLVIAGVTTLGLIAVGGPAKAKVFGPNGRIVFLQADPSTGNLAVYLVNPDGTNPKRLPPWEAEFLQPRWSPDGTEISLSGDACGTIGRPSCADLIVNPDTGDFRLLPVPDRAFVCRDGETVCGFGCFFWSPDGSRLACLGTSSADPTKDGLYTIRASDGGDVRLVWHFPANGWEDFPVPKDFSPDGNRLLYVQVGDTRPSGLFLINLDGTHRHRISPPDLLYNHDEEASWSPTDDWIVFTANVNAGHRRAIFMVRADGTGFHKVPIPACGGKYSTPGSVGCGNASWSPDGRRIIYQRVEPAGQGTYRISILTVRPDGTDPVVVTHSRPIPVFPDWGPHPVAP